MGSVIFGEQLCRGDRHTFVVRIRDIPLRVGKCQPARADGNDRVVYDKNRLCDPVISTHTRIHHRQPNTPGMRDNKVRVHAGWREEHVASYRMASIMV